MDNEWQKTRAEADIAEFKNAVEEGVAIGVYYEPGRMNPVRLHIDWADDRDRLTLLMDDIIDMTESEYYTEDGEELSG